MAVRLRNKYLVIIRLGDRFFVEPEVFNSFEEAFNWARVVRRSMDGAGMLPVLVAKIEEVYD